MKRNLLSLLLSAVMLIGTLPVSVLAAETMEPEAVEQSNAVIEPMAVVEQADAAVELLSATEQTLPPIPLGRMPPWSPRGSPLTSL